MKKYIISSGLFLLMFLFGYDIKSQEVMMPDDQMQSALKDLQWKENGTVFCTFNGNLYMIVWASENYVFQKNYYPYVYKYTNGEFQPFMVNNTNKLKFGYKTEDSYVYKDGIYNFIVEGKPLAFSYYGKMWFYSMNQGWENLKRVYYELWAQYDEATGWKTWYNRFEELPDQLNMGVCQVDSTLRFIAHETSTNKFVAKDYQFNSITNKLDFKQSATLSITGDRLDDVLVYKDKSQNNCFIYNIYQEATKELKVKLYSPAIGWKTLFSFTTVGVSSLLQGSVQGMRTSESHTPENSNRFNCFIVGAQKLSTNCFPLYDYTIWIPDDATKAPELSFESSVVLPASAYPDLVSGEYCLQGATLMTPRAFGNDTAVKNGLAQQLMLFYPDSKKKFNGAIFNSDFWRPVPGSSVSSLDLADDSIYGPEIRKLWTLVGIVDGAPPCSIDWLVWEEHHFTDEPTELSFTVDNQNSTEVTSSFEDTYSLGGSIKTGFSELVTFESSFKYANTYKSKVSSKSTVKSKLATNFGLNEHSQELGYFIWNIPQITRVSYQVYPWYDNSLKYPVSNSLQYQFRTLGVLTLTENKEISEFPFKINEPNDPSLNDWKAGHRVAMHNDISGFGVSPLQSIGWTNPNAGQVFTFSQTNTSTSSVEKSNSYNWGISASVKIPAVFKITGSYDQDITYSTENTYETEFGTEVEVSLKQLTDKVYGINLSYYDMSIFWFKPNVAPWWYLDSLNGQKPWYIAYLVGTSHAKITQLSPDNGSSLNIPESLFNWEAEEEGVLDDYTFYISTEPQAGPGSTVYSASCGKQTYAGIKNFTAEPGKTYYWSVRGITRDGDAVWSESRAFTSKEDISGKTLPLLKASIYPNPGKCSEINIYIDSEKTGPVEIMLLDISGIVHAKKEIINSGIFPLNTLFQDLYLSPGIYFAVIRTDGEQIVRKIIAN